MTVGPQEMRRDMRACTQEHAPECTATCPVHVDVRGLLCTLREGDFSGALAEYQKMVLFPRLVSAFCTSPCQKKCAVGRAGQPVSIRALEESLCHYGIAPGLSFSPFMELVQTVAVVGGGISGLAAALFLYEKGFRITLYEEENRLGGRGWALDEALARQDFAFLNALPFRVELGQKVGREVSLAALLEGHGAVYLSGDAQLTAEYTWAEDTLQSGENPKLFVGGSVLSGQNGYSIVHSIFTGRKAALSIDRFLKGVSLSAGRQLEGSYQTDLFTFVDKALPADAVVAPSLSWPGKPPTQPGLPGAPAARYSQPEALREAGRCIQCQCLQCQKQCVYLQRFQGYPYSMIMEMATHIRMIGGQRQAGPLINSCSMCGLCQEICPNSIQMPKATLAARQTLVNKSENVAAVHDFPLRDMRFSGGEEASLWRHGPGQTESRYLFFPGCQLTAVLPGLMLPTYQHLLENLGAQVGVALGCCGAPAHWAGYARDSGAVMENFVQKWEEMGSPTLLVACPTCQQQILAYRPDLPVESLWAVFARHPLPENGGTLRPKVAVQDACGSRSFPEVHQAVRALLGAVGCTVEEMEYSRKKTKCCTYGGLMRYGNPGLARQALRERLAESERDFLVYCGACREQCQRGGKKTWHLLELMFGREYPAVTDITEKRQNRRQVRRDFLNLLDPGHVPPELEQNMLEISPEVRKILDERLVLLEDVREAVEQAEETGVRLKKPKTGHYITHMQKGYITYWVEYAPSEAGFSVYNAYTHRLQIVDD